MANEDDQSAADAPKANDQTPRLFLSYSWTSPAHEAWVVRLAEDLENSGIHVEFDKWVLREGQDADAFMERMVSDPRITKVIMVCDRAYKQKADARKGGVGTEAQIISADLYGKTDQTKFVAVLSELDEDGKGFTPVYYGRRIFIDLSDEERYDKNFETLTRWVWDEPLYQRPPRGPAPHFVTQVATEVSIPGASPIARRALTAIREHQPNAVAMISEYLELVSENYEQFTMQPPSEEAPRDEQFMDSIQAFRPWRDELLGAISLLIRNNSDGEWVDCLHAFIEQLLPFNDVREATSYRETDFDNFRFLTHELFLYIVAFALKHRQFTALSDFLDRQYYYADQVRAPSGAMMEYGYISQFVRLSEERAKRLEKNRLCHRADLLKERATVAGVSFDDLMQADFVLFLRCHLLRMLDSESSSYWRTVTLVFAEHRSLPFELFARSQSRRFFEQFCPALGISNKSQLDRFMTDVLPEVQQHEHWGYRRTPVHSLVNISRIATRP